MHRFESCTLRQLLKKLLCGAFLVTELWLLELEPVRFGADSWRERAYWKRSSSRTARGGPALAGVPNPVHSASRYKTAPFGAFFCRLNNGFFST